MSITRLGTANMYDRTISNISKQQAELASQMEHTTAGKRVLRASDDPVAAALAERARTRMSRYETDQRTLDAQVSSITYASSTLDSVTDALQEFHALVVQAGNAAYDAPQRESILQQMQTLRTQILAYANRQDSNGLPLFRGLDTQSATPFPNGSQSNFQAGQTNTGEYSITNALNGGLAFFSGNTGNGVLEVSLAATNTGKVWADVGTIQDPSEAATITDTAPVHVKFAVDAAGQVSYSLYDSTGVRLQDAGGNPLPDYPYEADKTVTIKGMNLVLKGTPADGDTLVIRPSQPASVFDVMDAAIANIRGGANTPKGTLEHGVARALAEIDTALNRISTVNGMAGDMLNQADRMGSALTSQSDLMEARRSGAEDIDMVAALSQLKTQETAVSAALQSYASIQKLSLFDYIR